jgi:hypothetical protein
MGSGSLGILVGLSLAPRCNNMYVVFIHGPAASGKHTIGSHLSQLIGLPLFHNHLAVDAAKSLFAFGTPSFNKLRATVWLTAFEEAAASNQSFIFTFHPEASVDPSLIEDLCQSVYSRGSRVHFIELVCSRDSILQRIGEANRSKFGKLTDADLYSRIESEGGFDFPALPKPLLVVNTDELGPVAAAEKIAQAVAAAEDRSNN